MREIEITNEQAHLIMQADERMRSEQQKLQLVLQTTLAGHGLSQVTVQKLDTDRSPPVLVIEEKSANGHAKAEAS